MQATPPVISFARFMSALIGASFSLLIVSSRAQQASVTPAATADEQPLKLSEFTVSAAQDKGYRAGNSVSATRIDTPIKDLPFAVSAFTDQFIADIGTRDLTDVLKYAPSVTSGSEGFSNGNAFVMVRSFQSAPQRIYAEDLPRITRMAANFRGEIESARSKSRSPFSERSFFSILIRDLALFAGNCIVFG